MLKVNMKWSGWLLIISVFLGLTVFFVGYFWSPAIPIYSFTPKVHLPMAANKQPSPPVSANNAEVNLVVVGDIMLARDVEQSLISNGPSWPFPNLPENWQDADIVLGNLETTVRPERNLEVVNQMTFDTTPENLHILKDTGFTHLSLANNHTDDYGDAVTEQTRQTVIDANLTPIGDSHNSELFVQRENINGQSLSIIGYNAFGDDLDKIIEAVKHEDGQNRFVIVFPHWGIEYDTVASEAQTLTAHDLIAAGADLIVGSHPHVVQNFEIIDDVPVIYSLGNFLFDQDFSAATQQGLTVDINISEQKITLTFVPVKIVDRQTIFPDEIESQNLLSAYGLEASVVEIDR